MKLGSDKRCWIDIGHLLGLTPENYTDAYDGIEPLLSGCAPGDIDSARPPRTIKTPWDGSPYTDVAAGIIYNAPWIQFVYPAIAEAGPGLASSIVFCGEDAAPLYAPRQRVLRVGERDHAALYPSSGVIQSCTQHIEHFAYNANGDIAEALDRPTGSGCEPSSSTYRTDEGP